jgi:hypothetical protein
MRIGALNASVRQKTWNPGFIYSFGDLGFYGDLSDLPTLFQDSIGTIPAVLGQPVGRVNSANGNGVYASQATSSKKSILKRMPTSGIRNIVGDSEDNTTSLWVKARVTTTATSMTETTDFGTHTLSPSMTIPNLLISETCTVSCDVRQIAGSRRALLFLAGAFVGKFVNFNFDTKGISASAGTTFGYTDLGDGSYRLWITAQTVNNGTGTAGIRIADTDTAGFREYTGDGVSTIGVTNFQLEKGALTNYQRVVGNYDVYEPGFNQVCWLDYDGVDDELVLNNPDLGTNATRIRAQLGGSVIEQGLTLGANLTLNTDNLGLILINRALSTEEQNMITNYYSRMVA